MCGRLLLRECNDMLGRQSSKNDVKVHGRQLFREDTILQRRQYLKDKERATVVKR